MCMYNNIGINKIRNSNKKTRDFYLKWSKVIKADEEYSFSSQHAPYKGNKYFWDVADEIREKSNGAFGVYQTHGAWNYIDFEVSPEENLVHYDEECQDILDCFMEHYDKYWVLSDYDEDTATYIFYSTDEYALGKKYVVTYNEEDGLAVVTCALKQQLEDIISQYEKEEITDLEYATEYGKAHMPFCKELVTGLTSTKL